MKLKKLSGLLSAVLAGAMVLSMAPAAFAVATDEAHTEYEPSDSTHHNVVHYEADGTSEVWSEDVPCTFEYNAQGTYVGTESGTFCICGNEKAAEPVEEPGTTYIPVDATHHRVHTVDENGKVTYDEVAACVFETGTCVCGNTCPHSTFKYENNGNGTHKVICADCGAVVTEAAECVYGEDGKGTCACGAEYACDHMGNHWKYVENGDGTHNVVCADCGAVVSANVACNYKNGVCITCGAKQPAKADDGIATKPGNGPLDPNFSVGYHPICEFFRAVFRFLFGRH